MDQQVEFRSLLTVANLMELFGVTRQTIYNWRMYGGLPYLAYSCDERPAIRFDKERVTEWAKENDKDFYIEPAKRFDIDVGERAYKRRRLRKRVFH